MTKPDQEKLTTKQKIFCMEYIKDFNASRAAREAGYSDNTANAIGSENLTKPIIQSHIAECIQKRLDRLQIDSDWVLRQAVKVHERCMQGEPIIDRDGAFTGEWKFEHAGANKSLELIGKHVDVQAFSEKTVTETTLKVDSPLAERLTGGSKK